MYRVTDDYGTNQTRWTWCTALQWLAAASPRATVRNRLTGRLIAARHQRSY